MRFGITTLGCDGGRSGIGQYVVNLLHQIELCGTDEYEAIVLEGEEDAFLSPKARMPRLCLPQRLASPVQSLVWHQCELPRVCRRRGYDALFLPAANRRVPLHCPCPTVGTVHDFSSLHMTGKYDPLRVFYIKKVLPFLVRRLTHVVAVSECTRRDIVEYARVPEERVTVIPNGVAHDVYRPRDKEAAVRAVAKYGIRSPYILYISRIENPGKNHIGLIRAFELLKSREDVPHRLVLAGSDWTRAEEVHETAARSACAADIVFTGFVPGADLPDLYGGADVFVFPSLYEGFGMPLLEAMACGVPVACSNCSSLPEVAGDAALLFAPQDPESMASALGRFIADEETRRRYVASGLERCRNFTWEASARRVLELLNGVVQTPVRGREVSSSLPG